MIDIKSMENEMFKVAPLPVLEEQNGQFKIKLKSDRGETNWINISPEQFSTIEWILFGNGVVRQ